MTTYKPTIARYWCVTDLECTGLEPERHEIIQVARVVIDTVEGEIRSPKEGERYFALLKINLINFALKNDEIFLGVSTIGLSEPELLLLLRNVQVVNNQPDLLE